MVLEQCWEAVPGGTATSSLALAAALDARDDVAVTGVAARHAAPPRPPYAPTVPVRHLPLPRLALYEAWSRLRRPAVPGRPDVVHATSWAVPPRRAPLVVTVHDLAFLADPSHFTRRGVAFFTRALELVRREADVVVVPSQAVAAECAAVGLDDVRVVPHGVAPSTVSADDVARVRAAHGLTGRYVLWTGTQEPRKNLATLLAAFRRLDAGVDLVLVGPAGWGPDLAPAVAATPRVRSLGFVPDADRDALYAGAEVFAFPSLREGFGLPALEAMSHGTPVVTSAGTAMAEFAVGRLVDAADPASVAAGLADLLADDAARTALGAQARERAASMTWAAAAEQYVAAYAAALARG